MLRAPVASLLTITVDIETYVNSNLPLYRTRRRHASKRSTAPQSEPTVRREPSHFHASAVIVYRFSMCFTGPASHSDAIPCPSRKVRKRLNEPTATVSPEGLNAAHTNSFSDSSRE